MEPGDGFGIMAETVLNMGGEAVDLQAVEGGRTDHLDGRLGIRGDARTNGTEYGISSAPKSILGNITGFHR